MSKLVWTPEDGGDGSDEHSRLTRLKALIDEYNKRSAESGIYKWFVDGSPFSIDNCPKHKVFFTAGKKYKERMFMAANRSGKTIAGGYEAACHATGIYPDWWPGKKFDKPTIGLAAGSTARATRDTVQKEIIGPVGAWGTGMIPQKNLGEYWALAGVPQGIDMIKVKHISGGWSLIYFRNYEQPIEAFYGLALDWIWPDEEVPHAYYNEMLLRTMTTNGIIFGTFTPLKGLTPMVINFAKGADYLAGAEKLIGIAEKREDEGEDARLDSIKRYKCIVQAGWDDAPWLSEDSKKQMEADTPPHMIESRRSGKPGVGSGNVYPIAPDTLVCKPFQLPSYYKKLYALDVGWNRTACLWAALDPQTDVLYFYDEYYQGRKEPALHAQAIRARGEWIPGVIDPAARGRTQDDGTQLIKMYKDLGLKIVPAINDVESGVANLWQRMSTGRLKIFNTLHNFFEEFAIYRRDMKGHIVKDNDHLQDCGRYIQNNLSRAKSMDQLVSSRPYNGAITYNI